MPTDKKKFFFLFIVIIICFMGCSPLARYKITSFFFDDFAVPSDKVLVTNTNIDTLPRSNAFPYKALVSIEEKPEFFFHPPYRDKKCGSCHENSTSNELIKPLPELCYNCHDDFNNKYKLLHGPVASGNCSACHNGHMAKFEKLLTRTGQQLCLYCHNASQVFANKMHERVGTRNCTDCHNPHGEDNTGMLKQGICYTCHDDFNTKFKTLHGPVASGYCTACHGSHMKKQLLRENQQLCLYCHNIKQVLKNEAHKKIKESNCTKCHNPHGGDDRFILIHATGTPVDNLKRQSNSDSPNKTKAFVNTIALEKENTKSVNETMGINSKTYNTKEKREIVSDILQSNLKQNFYGVYFTNNVNEIDTTDDKFKQFIGTVSAIVQVYETATISVVSSATGRHAPSFKSSEKLAIIRGEKMKERLLYVLKHNGIAQSKIKFNKVSTLIMDASYKNDYFTDKSIVQESEFIKMEVY